MKKILFLFSLLFLLTSASYSKTINLENIPDSLSVKKGDKIVFKLNGNPTTGYVWTINIKNPKENEVLIKTNEEYKPENKNLIGGGGTIKYTIKAQDKGTATISGYYSRPWEKVQPLRSYEITVTVK